MILVDGPCTAPWHIDVDDHVNASTPSAKWRIVNARQLFPSPPTVATPVNW